MEPLAKELTDLLSQNGMGTAGRVQGHSLKMQSCSEERPDANRTLQGPAAAAQLCFTWEKVKNRPWGELGQPEPEYQSGDMRLRKK